MNITEIIKDRLVNDDKQVLYDVNEDSYSVHYEVESDKDYYFTFSYMSGDSWLHFELEDGHNNMKGSVATTSEIEDIINEAVREYRNNAMSEAEAQQYMYN